ncbi:Phosphatidylinositol/phosphatidylcholine transfer protein SFH10 [Camellia lanceoleosa]|uniref:Phosphatidylinositol/phosphatidylcholine transfer protein SFH10 n=1 Tax=Camellia lanceoleosa TaxID=1840588 RepID=A0ACC0HQC7_9ERIC|nr:Phosphatidylinositol/phosphatidylcholine transfer protein SFH10 [Camellia lanceoleosa]
MMARRAIGDDGWLEERVTAVRRSPVGVALDVGVRDGGYGTVREVADWGSGFRLLWNTVKTFLDPKTTVKIQEHGGDLNEAVNAHFNEEIEALLKQSTRQRQSHLEDAELAYAVSLSLKAVEQENALLEVGEKVGASELEAFKSTELGDMGKMTSSNGSWRQVFVPPDKCTSRQSRLDVGSSSIQEATEDVEEQPLVRHRSRHISSAFVDWFDIELIVICQ